MKVEEHHVRSFNWYMTKTPSTSIRRRQFLNEDNDVGGYDLQLMEIFFSLKHKEDQDDDEDEGKEENNKISEMEALSPRHISFSFFSTFFSTSLFI